MHGSFMTLVVLVWNAGLERLEAREDIDGLGSCGRARRTPRRTLSWWSVPIQPSGRVVLSVPHSISASRLPQDARLYDKRKTVNDLAYTVKAYWCALYFD